MGVSCVTKKSGKGGRAPADARKWYSGDSGTPVFGAEKGVVGGKTFILRRCC